MPHDAHEESPVDVRLVSYRISQLEKRADDQSTVVKAIMQRLTDGEVIFEKIGAATERAEKLAGEIKGDIRWAVRLVLGALLTAVVTGVLIRSAGDQTRSTPTNPPSAHGTASP